MKYIFLPGCFLFLLSCSRHSASTGGYTKPANGYYVGVDSYYFGSTQFFLHIVGDTAFADFVLIEKFPRSLYSDTLLYSNRGSWTGKQAHLYGKNGKVFMNRQQEPPSRFIKLKSNEAFYKEKIDPLRNYALLRQTYESGQRELSGDEQLAYQAKYRKLDSLHHFSDLANSLPHVAFRQAFAPFRKELTP